MYAIALDSKVFQASLKGGKLSASQAATILPDVSEESMVVGLWLGRYSYKPDVPAVSSIPKSIIRSQVDTIGQ
jgi:hypothetical protein